MKKVKWPTFLIPTILVGYLMGWAAGVKVEKEIGLSVSDRRWNLKRAFQPLYLRGF
jgi:hypothetical protein